MNEPSPGSSLRIRPRTLPPGVNSIEPAPAAPPAAEVPPPAPVPDASPAPAEPKPVQVSRAPAPVTISRSPFPGSQGSRPPVPKPPIPAPNKGSLPPAAPSSTPPFPVAETKTDPTAGLKLRESEPTPSEPAGSAKAPDLPPPLPTRAPASSVNSTPPPAPPPVVYASPLLEPRTRPEDSKLFRVGVKIFFTVGFLLAVAFVWLGWRFVSQRYGAKPPEPVATVPAKVIAVVKPSPVPTVAAPTPSPVPTIPLIDEFVARLKVSGVAGGAKPRAMIDGALIYPGQMLEPNSGIKLDEIDVNRRLLLFSDREGHKAKYKY